MKIINVGFYADFDVFSSGGYFKTNLEVCMKTINLNFIKSVIKKQNLKIIEEDNGKLKVIGFGKNKKYDIEVKSNVIHSSNGFHYDIDVDEYGRFLIKNGFEKIKTTKVVINSDSI